MMIPDRIIDLRTEAGCGVLGSLGAEDTQHHRST
jgi:hypothetical protein